MLKFYKAVSFFLLSIFLCSFSAVDDELLIKKLVKSGMTDHVQHFEKFFNEYMPKNFVELGVGKGSEYFIRKFEKVLSIELIVDKINVNWIKKCKELYSGYNNWFCSYIDLRKNSILMERHKKPLIPIDLDVGLSYNYEIKLLIDEVLKKSVDFFKNNEIEMIFVDCGFIPRADLVNILFNKVPIIAVHDVNKANRCYSILI